MRYDELYTHAVGRWSRPEVRAAIAKDVLPEIFRLADESERLKWLNRLAYDLDVPMDALLDEYERIR